MGGPRSATTAECLRKEQEGILWVRRFLASVCRIETSVIPEGWGNFFHGDLASIHGPTIEVKSQPIDPERYDRNFVEVFEESRVHRNGLVRVADLLDIPEERLAEVPVRWPDGRVRPVGQLPFSTVSITSIAGSAVTIYVNPGAWLYAYRSTQLVALIRAAVLRHGLRRGAGRSDPRTYGTFVPLPRCVWAWRDGWEYHGPGTPTEAAQGLWRLLRPAPH